MRITRLALVARVDGQRAHHPFPWGYSAAYASIDRIGTIEHPELEGGGSAGGDNVAELVLPLDEAPSPRYWGWLASPAPNPAQALLQGETRAVTVAVEISTEVPATGSRAHYTVGVDVFGGDLYIGNLKRGTIIGPRNWYDRWDRRAYHYPKRASLVLENQGQNELPRVDSPTSQDSS